MSTKQMMEQMMDMMSTMSATLESLDSRVSDLEDKVLPKKNGRKNAPKDKEQKEPQTKSEKIEAWKKAHYSDKERAAYGVAAKAVREDMMAENAKIGKGNDGYLYGSRWTKEFQRRMALKGFGK